MNHDEEEGSEADTGDHSNFAGSNEEDEDDDDDDNDDNDDDDDEEKRSNENNNNNNHNKRSESVDREDENEPNFEDDPEIQDLTKNLEQVLKDPDRTIKDVRTVVHKLSALHQTSREQLVKRLSSYV